MINIKKKPGVLTSYLVTKNNVPFLKFSILENTGIVKHGFSTRLGGVSKGIYSSMNLSFARGDNPQDVMENYNRISAAIGFDYRDIVKSDQTHTTNIKRVTETDKGKGIIKEKDYSDIDGLITDESGIPLVTLFADCVPIYFVDPVNRAIGLAHSGWKGTVNKIAEKTVNAMGDAFNSKPSELIVCIAPSICQDCYEVSEDVAEKFNVQFNSEQINQILYKKDSNKYQLNLWKANEIILLESGIKPEHLALPDICTCCNKEILFSHRGLAGKRGNLGAIIMLK